MLKRIAYTLLFLTTILFTVHFLFTWMNGTVDSWYIDSFAHYIMTGTYPMTWPTMYDNPKVLTVEPPLYSLLLAGLFHIENADYLLHAIQFAMLVATMRLLFLMLKPHIGKYGALIAVCLFGWIPANLIYVGQVMTDLMSQFLFMLYLYCVYKYVVMRQVQWLSGAVFLGFFAGLERYSFLMFGPITLIFLILSKPKKPVHFILPIIGVAMLFVWIFLHHAMTGVWGVNDATGIRLHATAVYEARLLPPDDNQSLQYLRKYVPQDKDLHRPFWEFVDYLPEEIKLDWTKINILFGDIARNAILAHPAEFLRHVFTSFVRSQAVAPPYYTNLNKFGINDPQDRPIYCFHYHTMAMCNPIIMTPVSFPVWNAAITASSWFYRNIMPILAIYLFFPALVWAVFSKQKLLRLYALIFIFGKLPIGAFGFTDSRYIIPFYPLMILIMILSYRECFGFLHTRWHFFFGKKHASPIHQ